MDRKCVECGYVFDARERHYHVKPERNIPFYSNDGDFLSVKETLIKYEPESIPLTEKAFLSQPGKSWQEWTDFEKSWKWKKLGRIEIFQDNDGQPYVIPAYTDEELMKLRIEMKMPFGRHRGQKLEDLPLSYIEWLLGNVNFNPDQEWLEKELENQKRLKTGEGVIRRHG